MDMLTGFFPLLAWAIYEFSFVNVLITTTTFAAEVFPENPGAAMVPVVGGKNIIAFGAAYGLIPMLHIYSYLKAFMIVSVSRRDPYLFISPSQVCLPRRVPLFSSSASLPESLRSGFQSTS